MKAWDVEQDEEREHITSASDIVKGTRMPKTPDLSGQLVPQRRGSPFALDDFSSGAPANVTKP